MPKTRKSPGQTIGKTLTPNSAKASKKPAGSKIAKPTLYSNFTPIALQIPCSVPIPSSSSKPLTETTHYIYVRPHKTSSTDSDTDGRTVFVANLPVDITDRDLRTIFGRWGVIELCEISGGGEGDILEKIVLKELGEESDEEDDDEQDGADEGGEEEASRPEPTFQDTSKPLPRRLRPRRKAVLPTTVPDIIPLPSLNPRSTPFGLSGGRCAHITYLDTVSVSRITSHTSPIPLKSYGQGETTGLDYYTRLHSSLRPSLGAIKEYSDSSMARFDHLHGMLLSSRAKKQGAGALVDEDGFTVVIRGGRYGRTGGRGPGSLGVAVAQRGFKGDEKPKGKGASELVDFYKFQKVDRKRQELAGLRAKFEQDKAKVEEMKRNRRFKPY